MSGAAAMVLQVLTLMVSLLCAAASFSTHRKPKPLRTVMNFQYRYGSTLTRAIQSLYNDGGWTRYYQGLTAALIQGPLSRFGDTAANAGILALLESNSFMKELPSLLKTVFASLAAAAFRMILTPIDTLKTTLQTQGKPGINILKARVSSLLSCSTVIVNHLSSYSNTESAHSGMVLSRQRQLRLRGITPYELPFCSCFHD